MHVYSGAAGAETEEKVGLVILEIDISYITNRPTISLVRANIFNVDLTRTQSKTVQDLARRVGHLEEAQPRPIASDTSRSTASPSLVATAGRTTASKSPASYQNTPHAGDSQVRSPCHVVSTTESLHSAARHLGPHWFFNGVPMFSDEGQQWVSSTTGQQVQWSDIRFPMYRPTSLGTVHLHEGDSSLLDLIDRSTAQRIMGSFFSTYAAVAFPVIDSILFEITIETVYEILDDPLSSPKHVAVRACLLAALSVASRVGTTGTIISSADTERFAVKAQRLLTLHPGYTNLETLITVLLLVR